jgi:hypothetical protein
MLKYLFPVQQIVSFTEISTSEILIVIYNITENKYRSSTDCQRLCQPSLKIKLTDCILNINYTKGGQQISLQGMRFWVSTLDTSKNRSGLKCVAIPNKPIRN